MCIRDSVYVVSWNSVNADGSRTEGRVETGTRLNKVIASRSLQGHGVHDDTSQHVLVSGLQPSRTYNIRVCVFFFHLLQIHKSVLHMTSSKCLLTFKTKLKTYIVLSFPPFFHSWLQSDCGAIGMFYSKLCWIILMWIFVLDGPKPIMSFCCKFIDKFLQFCHTILTQNWLTVNLQRSANGAMKVDQYSMKWRNCVSWWFSFYWLA